MDAAARWMEEHGVPPPARGVRNTGEQAMLVGPEHACGAYIGVVPRQDQSGETDKQLPITKCGDGLLRRLLVQSAHHILGPFGKECHLRTWGLALAARGGRNAKKRAVVAVARKLAVLLHAMWKRGEHFEPGRGAAAVKAA